MKADPSLPIDDTTIRLVALCELYLRSPETARVDGTGTPALTFVPPLANGEPAIYARLLAVARARIVGITPAEWQALESDITLCKAFVGIASPTLAQNNAATKAHMRITAAMLRT